MSLTYQITHRTEYRYAEPVGISHQALRLRPLNTTEQRCLLFNLQVEPEADIANPWRDDFGNWVHFCNVRSPCDRLLIESRSSVRVKPPATLELCGSPAWESVRDQLLADLSGDVLSAVPFCFRSPFVPLVPELEIYARKSFDPGRPLLEAALDLTGRIHRDFTFDNTATDVSTPVTEVFAERRGVCQDFAHLQIACLRSLGLAARYVSGYLRTVPPPGQPRLVGADASHAWVSVWCPGLGWTELDPTNDAVVADAHVRLAYGRDYGDVAPVRGVMLGGGEQQLTIGVTVALEGEPLGPAPVATRRGTAAGSRA